MAGTVKLDPAKGLELAEVITRFCDVTVLECAQQAYDAVRTLGDDNHCVEQFKEKFNNFQNKYNADCVPAFDTLKKDCEEFTDAAEYIAKLAIDTSVKGGDVGTVASSGFDAAKNL